jgi:hypothetical protein
MLRRVRRRLLTRVRAPLSAVTMSLRGAAAGPRGHKAAAFAGAVGLLCASAAVAAAGTTAGSRTSATRVLTMYSVATGLQYINSVDDSERGKVNNPFDSATNKLAPNDSAGGDGPSAGDIAVYAVSLYSDVTLKRPAGSGVYTCYFNYRQHALCRAYYKTRAGGTLVASGPVDFNASGFTIVVTGGTNRYLGARGEVIVAAVENAVGSAKKKGAQRVDFELIR